MRKGQGIVYLVGAGPGDPGLITVRGLDLISRADVIVHDRIMGYELLADARADAEIIHAGKKPGDRRTQQEDLIRLMIERALGGAMVVRLKGGDPFVFGRGFEELTTCREAGVDCVVVPGVTSAFAVPAVAGIPITSRHLVRSIAVVTAKMASDSTAPPLDFAALSQIDTVSVLMGRSNLREFAQEMIDAGRDADTPTVSIEWGTTYKQRTIKATLGTIANACQREGLQAPIVTVVGHAAALVRDDLVTSPSPLAGKCIFVAHRLSAKNGLRRRLSAAGAAVIATPLVRVLEPDDLTSLDRALSGLEDFDWILFDSAAGVRAFCGRLLAGGRDVRALRSCKVAAFGEAPRRALFRSGIRADVASLSSPHALLPGEIDQLLSAHDARILYPCDESADRTMVHVLRRTGAQVTDVACFRTVERVLPKALRERIEDGVDAVVLLDTEAARRLAGTGIRLNRFVLFCVHAEVASQARECGLRVDMVVRTRRCQDIFSALTQYFENRSTSSDPGSKPDSAESVDAL
ncbi:MAG: uroporphyrinogen-III C-methyltransferase [Planctomycetes bacterium]|nr:uroporphyrinogen-III C-methyltransferase [Planctomycetota bacterium]